MHAWSSMVRPTSIRPLREQMNCGGRRRRTCLLEPSRHHRHYRTTTTRRRRLDPGIVREVEADSAPIAVLRLASHAQPWQPPLSPAADAHANAPAVRGIAGLRRAERQRRTPRHTRQRSNVSDRASQTSASRQPRSSTAARLRQYRSSKRRGASCELAPAANDRSSGVRRLRRRRGAPIANARTNHRTCSRRALRDYAAAARERARSDARSCADEQPRAVSGFTRRSPETVLAAMCSNAAKRGLPDRTAPP